jgi:hypothetical protein
MLLVTKRRWLLPQSVSLRLSDDDVESPLDGFCFRLGALI